MLKYLDLMFNFGNTLYIWWTGDPRIFSANIIWINPNTTIWIKNRRKCPKGELAVDVVLEKSAVKQSGDAWRVILDSCLPVLHLIDTRRSIPYAIKQVQELLGISCAFDQAVEVIYQGSYFFFIIKIGPPSWCI